MVDILRKVVTKEQLILYKKKIEILLGKKADIKHIHSADDIDTTEEREFVTKLEKEKLNLAYDSVNFLGVYRDSGYIDIDRTIRTIEYPEHLYNIQLENVYIDGIKLTRDKHYSIDLESRTITLFREYTDIDFEVVIYYNSGLKIKNKAIETVGYIDNIVIPEEFYNFKNIDVYIDGIKLIKNKHYSFIENSRISLNKTYYSTDVEIVVFY